MTKPCQHPIGHHRTELAARLAASPFDPTADPGDVLPTIQVEVTTCTACHTVVKESIPWTR